MEDSVLWELTCLDADALIERWESNWQEAVLSHAADAVMEHLDYWSKQDPSESLVPIPPGLTYVDYEFSWGNLTWKTWVQEIASAAKGGRGLQSSITGQIALACIGKRLRLQRGFSNFWVDESESLSEIKILAEQLRRGLQLSHLITLIWDHWRRELETHLVEHKLDHVTLYRLIRLDPVTAPGPLKAIKERYKPGCYLADVLPQASLSAWTISRQFAEGWMQSTQSIRVLLEAQVPRDAIWLAPGFGEGELIVSPVGFGDHRHRTLAPVHGEITITSLTVTG